MKLLAKYSAVLSKQLADTRTSKKMTTTYLSPTIRNELILLLSDKVKDIVVEEVRKAKYFAIMCNIKNRVTTERLHQAPWHRVTVDELKQFFGLVLLMRINPKPQIEHYWSTRDSLRMPIFAEVMSRDHFLSILRLLHIVDNQIQNTPGVIVDTLWKIRPLINHLSSKFKRLYTPGQQLSLDEGLCAYKGRWLYLSYNPKKPHKWGVKIFQICNSNNGYCCRFKIVAGRSMHVRDLVLDLM